VIGTERAARVAPVGVDASAGKHLAMNPLQSILIHLDASPRAAVRLEIARRLVHEHGAAMACALFAVEPVPRPLETPVAEVPPPTIPEIDRAQRERARAIFDAAVGGEPLVTWAEIPPEDPARAFSQAALYADLVILGQKDPDDPRTFDVPDDFVEDVLLQAGKPSLIVPFAGTFPTVATRALIAWKPTRETARAVACAIPLLQRARRVRIVSWGEDPFPLAKSTFGIGRYLKWHGIDAEVRHYTDEPADLGELLLSRVADESADLLVMGCYSHSRVREMVLGGATRTVLKSMTCPVLMSH
jgi:nucleotide-binding universal stress UspA family protein